MSQPRSDSASSDDLTTTEEKAYHPKRPHKKSRTGCKNCKARKVKCNEARPTCRSCRLRKTPCVYPSAPAPASARASAAAPSPPSSTKTIANANSSIHQKPKSPLFTCSIPTSTPSTVLSPIHNSLAAPPRPADDIPVIAEPLFRPPQAKDELDMCLLWFYTTATCSSFSVEGGGYNRPVETTMRTRIVQHAFQHPFLMDSIFALSSLHLQSLGQKVNHNRSLAYRATSFEGYRRAVQEANPETYPALIANALILTALSSQSFREPDAKDLFIIDWMIVWNGIGVIINVIGFEKLVKSGLDCLFYRPPIDLDTSAYSIPNQLLYMISSMTIDDADYPDSQTYYDTLKYLGSLYYSLNEGLNPIMTLRIITWFTFVPDKFLDLGRQKRPRALVILAYYAVFLKIGNSIWWLKGIGQRSLRDICRHLGPEWSHLLKIPMLAISTDDPFDIARLVLEDPEWTSPSWPKPEDENLNEALGNLSWVDDLGRKCEIRGNEAIAVEEDRPKARCHGSD
ncbi:hypothetical protein ACO1O0_002432 [Amphichorda felina]